MYKSMSFEVANEGVRKENRNRQLIRVPSEHVDNTNKACVCFGSHSLFVLPLNQYGSPGHHWVMWARHVRIFSEEVTKRGLDISKVCGHCMSQNSLQIFMGWNFLAFNFEFRCS